MPEQLLITGGCGFIGSNFIRHLMEQECPLNLVNLDKLTYAGSRESLRSFEKTDRYDFIQGDIADRTLLDRLFSDYDFSGIIHFAAESHVDNSITGPEPFIHTNINGTFALLEAARKHWKSSLQTPSAQRFLHISTDEVFGSLGPEGAFTEQSAYAPNSPYSASKAASDHLVRSYHKTYGLNTVITNCSNNFGPYQHSEKLIPTIVRTAITGADIPIYGEGSNVRDWLYVGDHCRALDLAYRHAPPGSQYVIGGGNEYSNLSLARQICHQLDAIHPRKDGRPYQEQIRLVPDRPGHDYRYAVDATKIRETLQWAPQASFEASLAKTISWHLEQNKGVI